MLTFLAGIAEFERENLLERQREGIAIAKRKGVYKGRKNSNRELFIRTTPCFSVSILTFLSDQAP